MRVTLNKALTEMSIERIESLLAQAAMEEHSDDLSLLGLLEIEAIKLLICLEIVL